MTNLPSKIYNERFFSKIKRFFINIFRKNKNKNEVELKKIVTTENTSKINEDFKESLQSEITRQEKIEQIISYIDNNENSIYSLSNEKLKELSKMYDEQIKKIDMQIMQLKFN